jgi:hypothetical protein
MSNSLLNKLFSVCQNQRLVGIFFVGLNSIDELGKNDLEKGLAGWIFFRVKLLYSFPTPSSQ